MTNTLRLLPLLASLLPSFVTAQSASDARLADSVRREVGTLAAQGRLEQALGLAHRHAAQMPAAWTAMFEGKLELDGEASAQGYSGAGSDSAPEQMRGEAVFRLGQFHYTAGRYHLAIPQFRLYVARFPDGVWAEASSYWMAHACLQFARQRPDRVGYLDTAAAYLRALESRGRGSYYWPLARAAHARVHLERGDTAAADRALRDARSKVPAEETAGVLLLSLQAQPGSAEAAAWEDSLRWSYPLSPETQSLARTATRDTARTPMPMAVPEPKLPIPAPPTPTPSAPRVSGGHALQLGAFALRENAERLRTDLATKKIDARIASTTVSGNTLYRVLAGDYPDPETAQREGKRLLEPLGYSFRVVKGGE